MAAVELDHVGKTYDRGHVAVRDVSLRVEPGEFVVLVGPSGCGKSTLLRMIAGLEDVTSGTIRIGGRSMAGVRARDRDVAMVFQNYALYPHLSVRGNLAFALRMRHVEPDTIARKIASTAELLGLTPHLDRRPRELSGGERQRVALGRALVREPQVFLFDEPLSNLDAKLRVQMRAEIKHLHRTVRSTMIYVTHDQVEAMTLGDRIAVMNAGSILQASAPFEIYRSPANRFVAEFIGTPAINIFRGRLTADRTQLESHGVTLALPPSAARRLNGARDENVDVGIRPEHVRVDSSGADSSLEGEVEVLEPLGGEVLVHWRTPVGAFVSRVDDDHAPAIGARAALAFDWDSAHFFSAETQQRITIES
ncbi:MAG TPA: sn-glycerol-3-phosphate ABC transporter ATP-binding protein UgpC [Candidatus Udaeobacter sp.]|nr:sn-glycerol-3-phosphate ABC transporter ATP-binding protein UgpC [Candidatus Udaeobacter sp.]